LQHERFYRVIFESIFMVMKFFLATFTVCFLILSWSCSPDKKGSNTTTSLRLTSGNKYYGGIFRVNENEYFRSLYPLNITEVVGHRIVNQIYEGLVMLSQADLSVVPCIAERYEIDSAATRFRFFLRKDVRFHDDPCFPDGKGRTVTAHDFKYCFTKLCEGDVNNQGSWVFEGKVKGCKEYLVATRNGTPLPQGVAGIQVIDDYTLEITLEKPLASFLYLLATPFTFVFPKEAVEKYGNELRAKAVGTGPFKIKVLKEDDVVMLTRNENYWGRDTDGNQLPYLDGIKFTFIKERKAELLEFKKGNLDMIYRLPLEMTDEIVDINDNLRPDYQKFILQVMPSLATGYYGFLHSDKVFGNKDVRIAFNYAVDRKKICDFTMKGSGIPALHGMVPPGMKGFETKAVKGYDYHPEKAREHLAKAGYPDGKGFPEITLQINSGGGTNEQIAEAVQKMLQENLNIRVNITKLPFAQHLENYETGKASFWRAGWVADYPDPENFLNLFWSAHIPPKPNDKAYLNSFRYKSDKFDQLFTQALQTVDEHQRNLLYIAADQQLMDDAAIMPLYYYKDHRLLQPYVRNFPQNAMEYRNFRDVYFVPDRN
jgi:oligopeptide transport system substrate-binding protein